MLPSDEEEPNLESIPAEELARAHVEYRRYRQAAELLHDRLAAERVAIAGRSSEGASPRLGRGGRGRERPQRLPEALVGFPRSPRRCSTCATCAAPRSPSTAPAPSPRHPRVAARPRSTRPRGCRPPDQGHHPVALLKLYKSARPVATGGPLRPDHGGRRRATSRPPSRPAVPLARTVTVDPPGRRLRGRRGQDRRGLARLREHYAEGCAGSSPRGRRRLRARDRPTRSVPLRRTARATRHPPLDQAQAECLAIVPPTSGRCRGPRSLVSAASRRNPRSATLFERGSIQESGRSQFGAGAGPEPATCSRSSSAGRRPGLEPCSMLRGPPPTTGGGGHASATDC